LSTGAAIARNATGISPGAGIGTFFSVGTGPGAASLINIPIGWVPGVLQYGGIATTLATTSFVGLDKYNIVEFGDVMIFILEAIPFGVGLFFTLADDANWGWFEDMKRAFQTGFSLPEG
ncbi:MAG: hypothetical protein IT323_15625, partial [Anaerolineae bacterium]|nr:hypothetical protein [Anaerolineae bacterium]